MAAVYLTTEVAIKGKKLRRASPAQSRGDGAHADLAARANLGPKSARMLATAGITSFSQLKLLGAVAAYAKVSQAGLNASFNLLWALEGAITGTHWRVLARERRTSLLLALDDHPRGNTERF